MKVAIYLDCIEHLAMGEKCIAAIRKAIPHAFVVHLTTPNGPTLPADERLETEANAPFAQRRALSCAMVDGDTLFIDSDVIVRDDVSHVFADDFDVAVTTDMKPGAEGIKYNAGVIFCRNPAYWRAIAEATNGMDFGKTPGDWEPLERAFIAVADSGKFSVKVLPGEEYNRVPADPEDKAGKLIHYRGKRKAWLFPIRGFESGLNTPMQTMIEQAAENLARDLPLFVELEKNNGEALIVAGGPSLTDTLPNLRMRRGRGGVIFALNGAHDWLVERGIVPDFHVLLDARPENVRFVQNPQSRTTYLVAAQCHPSIFDALSGHSVVQWVACTDTPANDHELASKFPGRPIIMIGGGATVGLKTMNLAYLLGFRKMSMYGFDSSYRNGENHAYRQDLNDKESRIEVHAAGRDFICAPWMAKQATEFQRQFRQLTAEGCNIVVHGDGLIPHIYKQLTKEPAHV